MVQTEQTEVHEVTTTPDTAPVVRRTVRRDATSSGVIFAQRLVWLIAGIINAIIAIRFILLLLGANQSAGFVDFIYSVSSVLVAPFVGIFGTPTYGHFVFDWSSILAIVVYSLIAWGLARLFTLGRPQDEV